MTATYASCSDAGIRAAVEAGFDSIEQGTMMEAVNAQPRAEKGTSSRWKRRSVVCFPCPTGPDNWLVQRAGTINPARMLGLEDEIGTLAVGKQADIVASPESNRQDAEHRERHLRD